jgi:hypothetical protein
LKTVCRWSEIPEFETEEEEAKFWSHAQLDARLMKASHVKANKGESTAVTLRLDPRMLARIKRIARSRYLDPRTMMKHWLAERLEKES